MSAQRFSVQMYNLQGVVFTGEVEAISSYNEYGLFDVLPDHANFISVIQQQLTLQISASNTKDIHFSSGVIRINQGKVDIYIGLSAQDALL